MVFYYLTKIKRILLHSKRHEICNDIRVPAEQHGWLCLNIHEAVDQFVRSNLGDDRYSTQDFYSHEEYKRPQSLVVIPRGRVRDAVGLVFLPDGRVCAEGNWWVPYMAKNPAYTDRFRSRKSIRGDVFTLLGMWSHEYYHWFHDTLPRLWNSLPHLPSGCRFLIHEQPKEYQLSSLLSIGISNDRLVFKKNKGDLLVERLWFSTPHGYTTFSGPRAIAELADEIKGSLGNTKISTQKRIYVSRSSAKTRRIINEHEIFPVLKKYNFKIETLESYSFEKQVEIMSCCDTLLGPHGAGLTNLIFTQYNAHIIEISGDDYLDCYGFMARTSGRKFSRFFCSQDGRDADYQVDPNKLDLFLSSILK